ncbi:MAG: hypothetical protein V4477_16645 [Pseudomonadota bacterium]
MPSEMEILEAAKAMVLIGKERRENGESMPSRMDEATAALRAAEQVRSASFRPVRTNETFSDKGADGCAEVDVVMEPDGVIRVTDIRTWKHEIDGE